MANKQISDLQARIFDGDSIIAHDVENTDPSTMSQKPYLTGSATGHAVADFIGNGEEYTSDLPTVDKHITGAISELHAINGYSYDAYDDTATYAVGDLCIYNNILYKAKQATTGNLPTNTTYWEQTSIADEINELKAKTDIEDITFTIASGSITDVKIRAIKFGNVAMITGYFRTTASIPDGTTILSGFVNPFTPSIDGNLYFNLLNETDGTPQRFRINSPYADFKNQGTLASGKTFVGTLTYICQ